MRDTADTGAGAAGRIGVFAARLRPLLRHVLLLFCYGTLGLVVGATTIYLHGLQSQTDLSPWHTVNLVEEFTANRLDEVGDLDGYLSLEKRLFAELDRKIYAEATSQGELARYRRGSRSDPEQLPRNWNRTFELEAASARGGVLLLHGMSDSPYSLRALGRAAHRQGFHVVGLRLPGHGTIPSGMVHATWKDMAAAVRLAMRHLRKRVGEGPIFIVGYSNGAALAVEYALSTLAGEDLPQAAGLVLVAPAIGVKRVAALAQWQARLARWLDADKIAWTSVHPEVDPFKYTSFAVNAGAQVFALTRRISRLLDGLGKGDPVEGLPPVLAFLSTVDATVRAAAVVDGLFRRLAPADHELVLFDVNERAASQALLVAGAMDRAVPLQQADDLGFALTVLGNEASGGRRISEWRRPADGGEVTVRALDLAWPEEVFALSHIATPFPPDDPVYGDSPPVDSNRIFLGRIEAMGERGVLLLPATWQVRLRHNPFYDYLEERTLAWMGVSSESAEATGPTCR